MLVHRHLIVRAEVENPLTDCDNAIQWMKELVQKIGMKILIGPFAAYGEMVGNKGVTCGVIIETSHSVLHCWDEESPSMVQLDVYSCAEFNIQDVIDHLNIMKPVKVEYKFLERDNDLRIVS